MPDPTEARRLKFVISCEHASNRVPEDLHGLGLPVAMLRSHHASDIGALSAARALARAQGARLHAGRWSRLLADLNRSEDHPRVIARRIGDRAVPGNAVLDGAQRRLRIERYWRPYREAVESAAATAAAAGTCLHLSVHSFVERLGGVERRNDVGLLFDPQRPREREIVLALKRQLLAAGLSVRLNFPYFGDTDGMTSHLRARLPASRYLGIEIELNQRLARTPEGLARLTAALVAAVKSLCATAGRDPGRSGHDLRQRRRDRVRTKTSRPG